MKTDFNTLTVAELKQECNDRKIAVSGTKAVLIARLEAHDGASSAPAASSVPAPKAAKKTAAPKPAKATAARSKKRAAAEMLDGEDDEEAPATMKVEVKAVVRAPPAKKGKGSAAKVDQYYRGKGAVYEDSTEIWDVMLMQVSIERNNNKFYVLQLIENGGNYDVWTRWGRVSEPGQNKVIYSGNNLAAAKTTFGKKFKDKTKNTWGVGIRENFKALGSKAEVYTLMDMADADECEDPIAEDPAPKKSAAGGGRAKTNVRACTLDARLQSLLSLIFNEDTITEQLKELDIDVNRMPVGRISKAQLEKGRGVLEEIAAVLNGERKGSINDLTSEFYTYVPQSFGRSRPPPLNKQEELQKKFDLVNTLTDMTVAQDLMAKEKDAAGASGEIDHPLDRQYRDLDCTIDSLDKSSEEYQYVSKYFEATKDNPKLKLLDVFAVDRKGEAKRFSEHSSMGNRKLLWHGTNIAVVVAILKTGLRIMPHSGGRVGRGIYHASECSKSAGYVRTAKKTGVMFIDEVILGKPHEIAKDDWTITKPPAGFDSVLAQGWTEPDSKLDLTIKLDGNDVVVPQGKVSKRPEWTTSRFSQSEYLVYKESQVRMRYMLRIEFPY